MKHLGLFEGIGGFSLAARWMGWEMNRYRAMYLNEFDIRLSDRETYEKRITELERQINIETL